MKVPSDLINIITQYMGKLYWYRTKGRLIRWDIQALLESVI